MDIRSALEATVTIASAVAVVVTLRAELRAVREWLERHERQDAESFKDVRSQLAELRAPTIQHRPELSR